MSYEECPKAGAEGCPFIDTKLGCKSNRHHKYWLAPEYTTAVEDRFRNLVQNIGQLCMWEHKEIPATQEPPLKPTRDQMIQALAESTIINTEEAA